MAYVINVLAYSSGKKTERLSYLWPFFFGSGSLGAGEVDRLPDAGELGLVEELGIL